MVGWKKTNGTLDTGKLALLTQWDQVKDNNDPPQPSPITQEDLNRDSGETITETDSPDLSNNTCEINDSENEHDYNCSLFLAVSDDDSEHEELPEEMDEVGELDVGKMQMTSDDHSSESLTRITGSKVRKMWTVDEVVVVV